MARELDPALQSIINKANMICPVREDRPQLSSSRHLSTNDDNSFRFQPASALQEKYTVNTFDRAVHSNSYVRQEQVEASRTRVTLPSPDFYTNGSFGRNRYDALQDLHSQRQSFDQLSQINQPLHNNRFHEHREQDTAPQPASGFLSSARQLQFPPHKEQLKKPFNRSVSTPLRRTRHFSSPLLMDSSPTPLVNGSRILQPPDRPISYSDEPIISFKHVVTPKRQTTLALTHAPPIANGIPLISTQELPDRLRQVFPFDLFNAVQSRCFKSVYNTDNNIVVAAPTGSGKTAIMELAICKLVEKHDLDQFKIVYQAPTKSLCAERVRDWEKKFKVLNLDCAELTGDTEATEMRKVRNASIIVTTPEKWDSITRKWKDYIKLLQMVKLFLIDEVHILKDSRGATLEAVVSRMKSIGAQVRFVALSATVPNSQDIAVWLGQDHANWHLPACREVFGEDFRPVKLQKHVYGFDGNANGFAFDTMLESKLLGLVAKHTYKKPIMIFCFTRKSCENTASKLAQWWAASAERERAWPRPSKKINVISKELIPLVTNGVAFHHAGLEVQDRTAVENAFLTGQLHVICCTSTLAVGVNLPCHLVIIKGTIGYTDTGLAEYSDLEIMQMLGRAGRPQFDDSAVAVIMTRNENVDRYKKMISGQEMLESTLHLNLIEHLNSEIGLGTVSDAYSAKRWLEGTFLSVRMRENPSYYKFTSDTGSLDVNERFQQVCETNIKLLQDAKLITNDENFRCTEYGQAMTRYMIQFETMKLLLGIPKNAKMDQISVEFKDLRMKSNERAGFRELNKSPSVKYPIKENILTTAHKVSLIVQVQLGGVDLPNEISRRQYVSEKEIVFDRMYRLVRCVADCKIFDSDGISVCNALELARSISAEYWENMPVQLRQIPNFGPASTRKLVQGGVNSILKLTSMDGPSIERVMSRNPPFGQKVLDQLRNFPRLTLTAEITRKMGTKVQVNAKLGGKTAYWNHRLPSLTFIATAGERLVHLWRGNVRMIEKGLNLTFMAEVRGSSEEITCLLACEEIVGTSKAVVLVPGIPASTFPEFEWDLEDDDMLAAIDDVENLANFDNFDEFVDIDDIEDIPVKMENGKWMCNHACRDGNTLKNGKTCKHKCCHKGLDKPRKAKRVEKKLGSKLNLEPVNLSDVEVIDLVGPTLGYGELGPREHRKPHNSHAVIQKTEAAIPNFFASYSYTSGAGPDLECVRDDSFSSPPPAVDPDLNEEAFYLDAVDPYIQMSSSTKPASPVVTLKRGSSPTPRSEVKSRRIDGPSWLDQIDADIVAEFAGLVEFVDDE